MFVFVFYLIHFDIKQSFNIFVLIIYKWDTGEAISLFSFSPGK